MSILTVWIMVNSVFVGLIGFDGIGNAKAGYTQHNPIRINNNTEFASLAGLEGWAGDGSPGNPYIIEGYDINGSGYGYCIYIGNTTVYFKVRNSYLHEASGVAIWPYFPNAGLTLYNVQNGIISNNTASLNSYYGISLDYSSSNTIENNTASNNDIGINLGYLSSNNTIVNNTVSSNFYGIYLYSSSSNTIANNTADSNSGMGIYLLHSSSNAIANNTAVSNSECGIRLYDSSNHTIANNTASNNLYGIYLYTSSNNLIYHNSILNNTNQAYDDSNNGNQWDNGYPSGGNFWSDYIGYDSFKGPNQDIPGNDGIGDTNYSIDNDSVDNYPLMQPYKPLKNYLTLREGWNLISLPFIQKEQNLTRVLGAIDGWYDAVQWYDITEINDHWKHYKVGKPFGNDLYELNESMGFWIHVTQHGNTIFVYNGTQPTINQTINLIPGWNLVGYPSISTKNRTNALNNIDFGSDVDAIWIYNTTTQTWKEITASDNLEVGRGYWIHSKVTKTWIVPL